MALRLTFLRYLRCAGWGILLTSLWVGQIAAQSIAPPPSSRHFSLRVPEDAKIKAGHNRRVLVRSPSGDPEVGQLLCRVDDQFVVIRPCGELTVVERERVQPCDKKAGRITKKEIVKAVEAIGVKDYKIAAAKPYVFAYGCSEAYYLHTRSILESMYPGVVQQLKDWGLKVRDPATPLIVVITPSREEFDKIMSMPPEVLAYYNVVSNQVVLYEDPELSDAAPEYALKQAAYTIAHEGIHQLLANTGVQQRLSDWPMWISEGLPEFFCPLAVNSKLVTTAGAQLPVRTLTWTKAGRVNDLRMFSLLERASDGGQVIRNAVMTDDLDADGYAISWGLVHYLVKRKPEEFKEYLTVISQLEPLHEVGDTKDRQQNLFIEHFGNDFAGLEREVQQYLNSRGMQKQYIDPIANQTRYLVRQVIKRGKSYSVSMRITTSPAGARAWKEEQQAKNKTAKFFTKVCKSLQEAEYEMKKFNALGR